MEKKCIFFCIFLYFLVILPKFTNNEFANRNDGTWGHQKSSTVYIYDVETLTRIKTLSCFFGEKISGVKERRGSIASVTLSQDNSQLLVSSDDGVVVVYNLKL